MGDEQQQMVIKRNSEGAILSMTNPCNQQRESRKIMFYFNVINDGRKNLIYLIILSIITHDIMSKC